MGTRLVQASGMITIGVSYTARPGLGSSSISIRVGFGMIDELDNRMPTVPTCPLQRQVATLEHGPRNPRHVPLLEPVTGERTREITIIVAIRAGSGTRTMPSQTA